MEILLKSKTYGSKFCYIDDTDHNVIKNFTWCIVPNRNTFYAMSRIKVGHKKYKTIRMHQLIMGKNGTDHKNGNGLDNRRINLREATTLENNRNVGLTKRNRSGYKGVHKSCRGNCIAFIATIRVNGKLIHGGSFKNPKDAALKYNELASKYFGEFAWINPIT